MAQIKQAVEFYGPNKISKGLFLEAGFGPEDLLCKDGNGYGLTYQRMGYGLCELTLKNQPALARAVESQEAFDSRSSTS